MLDNFLSLHLASSQQMTPVTGITKSLYAMAVAVTCIEKSVSICASAMLARPRKNRWPCFRSNTFYDDNVVLCVCALQNRSHVPKTGLPTNKQNFPAPNHPPTHHPSHAYSQSEITLRTIETCLHLQSRVVFSSAMYDHSILYAEYSMCLLFRIIS